MMRLLSYLSKKKNVPVILLLRHLNPSGQTIIDIPDPLKTMVVFKPNGEEWRIDKELYSDKFEGKVKDTYEKSAEFKSYVDSGNYGETGKICQSSSF